MKSIHIKLAIAILLTAGLIGGAYFRFSYLPRQSESIAQSKVLGSETVGDQNSSTTTDNTVDSTTDNGTVAGITTSQVQPTTTDPSPQPEPPRPPSASPREILTPEGLDILVVREGTGTTTAEIGDTVKIQYQEEIVGDPFHDVHPVGTGKAPYVFQLGSDKVIQGWNLGIVGMKVNETRKITIPPNVGYGEGGNKNLDIPPGALLQLRVTLLKRN